MKGLALQFTYGEPKQSDTRTKELYATAALATATRHLRESAQAAGRPNFPNGDAYAQAVVDSTRQLETAFQHLHDKAESLPTGDARPTADALLEPGMMAALTQFKHRADAIRERYSPPMTACDSGSS